MDAQYKDLSSVLVLTPKSAVPVFYQSLLSSRFLPSQNPFLSIRAETDTRPSGINMQETFFSFLADTGAYVEWERKGVLRISRNPFSASFSFLLLT